MIFVHLDTMTRDGKQTRSAEHRVAAPVLGPEYTRYDLAGGPLAQRAAVSSQLPLPGKQRGAGRQWRRWWRSGPGRPPAGPADLRMCGASERS